jgi:hypothetical protein
MKMDFNVSEGTRLPVMVTMIGVDPGLSGAFGVLNKMDNSIMFGGLYDMPVYDGRVDAKAVAKLLSDIELNASKLFSVCLRKQGADYIDTSSFKTTLIKERQIAMPGVNSQTGVRDRQPSPASMGNFFHGGGIIEGVAAARGIEYREISAAAWKTSIGCPANKNAARAMACRLVPEAATELKHVKDHGRAEALLLAAYGLGYRG